MSADPVVKPTFVDDLNPATHAQLASEQRGHLDRLEQHLGASLFEKGVLSGLTIGFTIGQGGVTVAPGVAVNGDGRFVVLASNGRAQVGAAAVPAAGGVFPVPTAAGLSHVLVVAPVDAPLGNLAITASVVNGTELRPSFSFYPAATYVAALSDVVLGYVATDAAGNVTSVLTTAPTGGAAVRLEAALRGGALALREPSGAPGARVTGANGGVSVSGPVSATSAQLSGAVAAASAAITGGATVGGALVAASATIAGDLGAGSLTSQGRLTYGGDLSDLAGSVVKHAHLLELVSKQVTALHAHARQLPQFQTTWLGIGENELSSTLDLVFPAPCRAVAWTFLGGSYDAGLIQLPWVTIPYKNTPPVEARAEILSVDGAENPAHEGRWLAWLIDLLGHGPHIRAPIFAGTVRERLTVSLSRTNRRTSRVYAGVVVMYETQGNW